jgi:hypothetical protein
MDFVSTAVRRFSSEQFDRSRRCWNFQFGQFHAMAIALAVAGMVAFHRDRHALGGALLSVAVLSRSVPECCWCGWRHNADGVTLDGHCAVAARAARARGQGQVSRGNCTGRGLVAHHGSAATSRPRRFGCRLSA